MASGAHNSEYLPPPSVGRWRAFERSGLRIRSFAGLSIHARLDPFTLAASLRLVVLTPNQLLGLSSSARDTLLQSSSWSGGATGELADGSHIILLNPNQSPGRRAATLMEEVCHILLGHKPTQISALKEAGRDYDHIKEEEAYSVGAAALLPYFALKECLAAGQSFRDIARRFGVTARLVGYRTKGLGLNPYL